MKKKGLILFSILGLICLFLTTGCGKTAIEAEDFKVTMDGKGFKVIDATSQFVQQEFVKKVYVAMSSDSTYQIEFYEFAEESDGKTFFDTNKKDFENNKGKSSSEKLINLGNYNKYTLTSGENYQVVSRIGNTAIFVNNQKKYKEDINSIIDELGY